MLLLLFLLLLVVGRSDAWNPEQGRFRDLGTSVGNGIGGPENKIEKLVADSPAQKRSPARKFQPQLFQVPAFWGTPPSIIPFDCTSDTGLASSEDMKLTVRQAFANIAQYTCLRFTEVTPANPSYTKYIRFQTTGSGCGTNSHINSSGIIDYISINLGYGCWNLGTVVHEVCHALGLQHEQSRSDRDSYLYIDYSAISPSMWYAFDAWSPRFTSFMNPYEYRSVMNYDKTAFGGGATTIFAPKPLGNRGGLTEMDAYELNFAYANCDATSLLCSHTVPVDATVTVGQDYNMRFVVNTGSGEAALVTYVLPPSARAYVPNNTSISATRTVVITVTGTPATLGQMVNVSVSFAWRSKSVTCSAAVFVQPYKMPINCFGYLPTDPAVCSGHGKCMYYDACKCDYPDWTLHYWGRQCEKLNGVPADILFDGLQNYTTNYNPSTTSSWVSPYLNYTTWPSC